MCMYKLFLYYIHLGDAPKSDGELSMGTAITITCVVTFLITVFITALITYILTSLYYRYHHELKKKIKVDSA